MSKLKLLLTSKWLKSRFFWIFFLLFLLFAQQMRQQLVNVQSEPITVWSHSVQADCGVVLTGGPGRIREGFDLLSQKAIKKLIVSGVNSTSSLTEIFPLWVFYPELKEEDIFLERRSETTFGNAQQSLPLVEALNCRDIILITSHLHMYRSYQTFRSIFPPSVEILKHSLPTARRYRLEMGETYSEAFKSLFYSLWAY